MSKITYPYKLRNPDSIENSVYDFTFRDANEVKNSVNFLYDTVNTNASSGVLSVNSKIGNVTLNTSDILESGNLYYTDSRVSLNPNVINGQTAFSWGNHSGLYIPTTAKGSINGVASLDMYGKLKASELPSLILVDTFVVASQTAMLALSTAEQGDVAIRTDIQKTFILADNNYGTLSSWKEMLSPTDSVASVNGYNGIVTLNTSNIPEGTNLYYTDSRVSTIGNTLYSPLGHTHPYLPLSGGIITGPLSITGDLIAQQRLSIRHIDGKNYGDATTTGQLYLQYFSPAQNVFIGGNDFTANVGIGTMSPGNKLHVNGTGRFVGDLYQDGTTVHHYLGSGTNNVAIKGSSGEFIMFTGTTGYTEALRVSATGNMGIGTTIPAEKLDIHNQGKLRLGTSNSILFSTLQTNDSEGLVIDTNYIGIKLRFTGNNIATFDGTGIHLAGGKKIYGEADYAFLDLVEAGSANTKLWNTYAYSIIFGTNNTERLRINSVGNVGLGIAAPLSKLHIISNTSQGGLLIEHSVVGGNILEVKSNLNGATFSVSYGGQVTIQNETKITTGGLYLDSSNQSWINTNGAQGIKVFGATGIDFSTNDSVTAMRMNQAGSLTIKVDSYINSLRIGKGAGTGTNNTALGEGTLNSNTTGNENLAIGKYALQSNTTGGENTAIGGWSVLSVNTTGGQNVGVGAYVLSNNISAGGGTAVGYMSLKANTIGQGNTAYGMQSLYANIDGNYNVSIGYRSMMSSTSVGSNVAIGSQSLYFLTTGSRNTAIGSDTGYGITTGSGNTIIGSSVQGLAAGLTNNIILANGAGIIKAQNDGTNWVLNGNIDLISVNGSYLGFTGFTTGMTVDFRFGDANNRLVNTFGSTLNLESYHGSIISNNASGSNTALRVWQKSTTATKAIFELGRSGTYSPQATMFNNGNLLLQAAGTHTDAGYKLNVVGTANATQFKVTAMNTAPISATDTGIVGEIRYTATYIYVCTATNTWVRSALTTW